MSVKIMRIFSDLKFTLMLAAAVAGVAVPYWLWRADQNAKAISVQLTSQVPLGLIEKDAIPGLQVVIEGSPVSEPYLSTVLIQNSGDKPIATADFESALEIRSSDSNNIYGARVSGKSPADIEPEFKWDKQTIRLKPMLLNPRDSITVSIITSGGAPNLSAKARIIGVPSVQMVKTTTQIPNPWTRWLFLVGAFAFAIPAMAVWRQIDIFSLEKPTISLPRRTVYLIVIVPGGTAMVAWMAFLDTYGIGGFWPTWLSTMFMLLVASIIGRKLDSLPEQEKKGDRLL